jgi:uncharacterized protein YcbK (DUF882 family)
MSAPPTRADRRRFLRQTLALAAASVAVPASARAAAMARPEGRSLALEHTHTGERLELLYAVHDAYVPAAMQALNHFLRDHYTGEVGVIDPELFDLLYRLRTGLGARSSFQVISGYRCPATNGMLKATRGGGVAKRSLHMDGKAIDIRLPGVPIARLRDAALSLGAGGVGFYPREQFVHVDTGRVRSW